MVTGQRSAKSRVKPHLFTADPDVPADQNGRQVCRCGLLGEAGDAHHTLPDPPMDVQQLRAGESAGAE